jgi:hypothetical protein
VDRLQRLHAPSVSAADGCAPGGASRALAALRQRAFGMRASIQPALSATPGPLSPALPACSVSLHPTVAARSNRSARVRKRYVMSGGCAVAHGLLCPTPYDFNTRVESSSGARTLRAETPGIRETEVRVARLGRGAEEI